MAAVPPTSDRPSLGQRLRRELAQTTRDPSRLVGYPRRLVRAARRGFRPTPPRAVVVPEAIPSSPLPATIREDRPGAAWFLVDRTVAIGPRRRPVVVGVLTASTSDALAPDVTVDRVSPDDAVATLEMVRPDLVLIEAAAVASGPWAHAGDPAAPDRTAALARLMVRAQDLALPTVLVRDDRGRAPVALEPLERLADLVLDPPGPDAATGWWRGVQLATYHPIGAPRHGSAPVVHVAGRGRWPRSASARLTAALLAAADAGVLDVVTDADGAADPRALDDLPVPLHDVVAPGVTSAGLARRYRSASVVIADPPRPGTAPVAVLDALACGAHVLAMPDPWLETLAGPALTTLPATADTADIAALVRRARDRSPAADDPGRLIARLRAIATEHTTTVRLDRLFRDLVVTAPAGHRTTATVVVRVDAPDRLAGVVDGLVGQVRRPTQVVVQGSTDAWPSAAIDALASAGIVVEPDPGDRHGPRPSIVGSWVIHWPSDAPVAPTALEDLLIGAAMRQTDVVTIGSHAAAFTVRPFTPGGLDLVSRDALADRASLEGYLAGDLAWRDDAVAAGWRQLVIGVPGSAS